MRCFMGAPMNAMMAILPMLMQMTKGTELGGQNAQTGSTYNKGALSLIDQLQQSLRGGAPNVEQNQNFQTGQNWLQSMFSDPSFFNQFEAPLQRQFEEQTIPQLANRFGAMGSGGALESDAFRRQLGREGSNLQTNIAALRGGMQQQAIPQLLGYAQQPFNNYSSLLQNALTPTQNTHQGATPGLFGNLFSSLFGGAATGYGQQWGQNMAGNGLNTNISPDTGGGFGAGWDDQFRRQGVV
jgi:hypothetical protein